MQEKLPPHNIEAEEAVLASVLIDSSSLVDVGTLLSPQDFYREKNKWIFEAMLKLGSTCNQLTLAHELEVTGKLEQVGGNIYLAQVVERCPSSAYAEAYAKIVRDLGYCRRVINMGARMAAMGYEAVGTPTELFERCHETLNEIEPTQITDIVGPKEHADRFLEMLLHRRDQTEKPIVMGWSNLDQFLGGLYAGNFVVVGARPYMGKSEFLFQVALHNCLGKKRDNGEYIIPPKKVLIASAEMSVDEFDEREAGMYGVPVDRLRSGALEKTEWDKLFELVAEISTRPMYFLEGRLTIDHIYQRAQLLQRTEGLDMVIVDYIQLLRDTAFRRGESATRERVSAISHGMKQMARELKIPVLTASQLNREVEGRENKMPLLSDLRECLPKGALVLTATGERKPIETVKLGDKVVTFGKNFALAFSEVMDVWPTGVKPIYELKTQLGRTIRCSAGHRFMIHEKQSIIRGWKELKDIEVGHRIAVPRRYPQVIGDGKLNTNRALLIGLLLGNAHLGKWAVTLTTRDYEDAVMAKGIADDEFGLNCRIKKERLSEVAYRVQMSVGYMCGAGKNPMTIWLREMGILGKNSPDKRIPTAIFQSDNTCVAACLRGLFHADGSISKRADERKLNITYDTVSPGLASDVCHLLTRLGIVAHIGVSKMCSNKHHHSPFIYRVGIGRNVDRVLFMERVGFLNGKHDKLCRLMSEFKGEFKAFRQKGDIMWDTVASIRLVGDEETYDLQMIKHPYFCVDDFITHNSGDIEQDADVVLMLTRPEIYDPVDEPGIMYLNVAKARQIGKTKTFRFQWIPDGHRYEPASFEGEDEPEGLPNFRGED